ncbi:hypothetical protein AN958_09492 [Leucoagaricus sp. SymC.cos]|nr:hypothetical protein AN958_09492 [Leucoagaricus sp. SymC.cos]
MPPPPALLHRYFFPQSPHAPCLLNIRYIDPLLGVFTGFLAYYLHETHPRTALSPDQRLTELIRWKWDKRQHERKEELRALDAVSENTK